MDIVHFSGRDWPDRLLRWGRPSKSATRARALSVISIPAQARPGALGRGATCRNAGLMRPRPLLRIEHARPISQRHSQAQVMFCRHTSESRETHELKPNRWAARTTVVAFSTKGLLQALSPRMENGNEQPGTSWGSGNSLHEACRDVLCAYEVCPYIGWRTFCTMPCKRAVRTAHAATTIRGQNGPVLRPRCNHLLIDN